MGSFVAPLTGHLDAALTQYAKEFRNHALVSDIVFPRVTVGRQTDKYYIWDRANQQLIQQDLRATGAPAQRVRRALSTDSYKAESHALAIEIPDESEAGFELGSLRQGATKSLMDLILLHKEKRFVDLMTTGNVTNNTTLSGSSQWSDSSGGDPIGAVETGKSIIRKAGVEANVMVIGESVYKTLIKNTHIVERYKYTKPGALGVAELAAVFNIDQVHVAKAVSVSAADVAGFLFDEQDVLICYVDPGATTEDVSFGKSFVWAGAPGTVGGIGVVEGRHPDPTAKSEIVGVDFYYDQKITATETGYLIKDAVA